MKKTLYAIAFALLLLCVSGFAYQRASWEYKTEFHGTMSEKKLNELGAQGWELVAIGKDPQHGLQTFYFKRPKT